MTVQRICKIFIIATITFNLYAQKNNETSSEPLTPLGSPLEFISPSIRAFESKTFSVPPEPERFLQPPEPQVSPTISAAIPVKKAEYSPWMQAPHQFISPSVRFATTPQQVTPFTYNFSGYIKNEAFLDSCQVIGYPQDQLLLFPIPPISSCSGDNINSKGRFNMLSIESRVRGEISGPYVFGAHTFGVAEIDAWASCLLQIGLLRIRHAFIYLEWPDKSLILGQYWHPVLLPECYADTIGFNAGIPFDPFAREPQFRLTKQFDTMTLILAIGSLANSLSDGPAGETSLYTRNAIMPNFNIQLFSSIRKHLCGIGANASRIVPRIVTNKNFCAHESLISWLVFSFLALNWEKLRINIKGIYAQNGNPYGMISGYAVSQIDPYTDERSYTNTQCLSAWLDASYKGEVEPGIFLAFTKNIGASNNIIPSITDPVTGITENLIYSSGQQNIDVVYRVQPRVRWFLKPFVLGTELDLTGASWGKVTETGRVVNAQLVNNVRVLFAAFYVF